MSGDKSLKVTVAESDSRYRLHRRRVLRQSAPGGWCAILRFGPHEKVLQGGASLTTNNRMELRAALAAFQALTRPCTVEIHTDSEYLKRGVTEWLRRLDAQRLAHQQASSPSRTAICGRR